MGDARVPGGPRFSAARTDLIRPTSNEVPGEPPSVPRGEARNLTGDGRRPLRHPPRRTPRIKGDRGDYLPNLLIFTSEAGGRLDAGADDWHADGFRETAFKNRIRVLNVSRPGDIT